MEYDPHNETKDSDDSDDSLPSSSNRPIVEYDSESMDDEEDWMTKKTKIAPIR